MSGCLIFSFLSFSLSLLDMKIKAMVVERKSARVGAGEVSFVKVQSRKCSSWPRGKKKKTTGSQQLYFYKSGPCLPWAGFRKEALKWRSVVASEK